MVSIVIEENVRVGALTDKHLEIKGSGTNVVLSFVSTKDMEKVADNLLHMAQALRNKEFNMIGGKDDE